MQQRPPIPQPDFTPYIPEPDFTSGSLVSQLQPEREQPEQPESSAEAEDGGAGSADEAPRNVKVHTAWRHERADDARYLELHVGDLDMQGLANKA